MEIFLLLIVIGILLKLPPDAALVMGGIVVMLIVSRYMGIQALKTTSEDRCPPHKYTKDTDGELICNKCKWRPTERNIRDE